MRRFVLLTALLLAGPSFDAQAVATSYEIEGDAIAEPLTGHEGDAERGAALVADRTLSLCVLCHSGLVAPVHMQGNLAPSLAGIGGRLTPGQIRLRVVDMKRLNPDSLMPVYGGVAPGARVAGPWQGKAILTADEIEDIVAYLVSLKG
ncbi:sulfur oxidation c-type cytochrome SoxX [Azorhizobium oxalatiphilum]|uniref:Sulfur oxidation c-type cytochrome SoxX n=1 Tax=Azorhizobium oxalatiphilum TaxID=980631 RepID=A0A917C6Z1_9HYPH|nr:sulfur oxidation c-type cytochrome SoxX [Azorhizobium oxalatiphilum]GGF73821.1 sulfur oxidation c-type cytochrome SoxX [Azorhizobium oxalatiphilum]